MRRLVLTVFSMIAVMMFATGTASAQTEDDFVFFANDDEDEFCEFFDVDDEDCFFFDDFDNDFDRVIEDGIVQETEQEAESGDVDQTFDVSGTGDNSNQTVGTQGVANTGNAQNVIDVVDAGDFNGDDFDGDDNRFFNDDCFFFDGTFICDDFTRDDSDLFNDGFFDVDGFFDEDDFEGTDFESEEVGSTIELSPTNTTTSDQQVNQAASATD